MTDPNDPDYQTIGTLRMEAAARAFQSASRDNSEKQNGDGGSDDPDGSSGGSDEEASGSEVGGDGGKYGGVQAKGAAMPPPLPPRNRQFEDMSHGEQWVWLYLVYIKY